MVRAFALLLVACLVCASIPALAQMPPGMGTGHLVSVGIGGGVSVPVHDTGDAFKNGWNGHGFVRLNLKGLPIVPRVDFSLQKFDLKDLSPIEQFTGPPVTPTGTGQVMAGLANVQLFLSHGPISPYIVAGVGAYNLKAEVNEITLEDAANSGTHFGINGGAGLVIHLGRTLDLYGEGRVDNVYTDKGAITADQIQTVPVTFGIVLWP